MARGVGAAPPQPAHRVWGRITTARDSGAGETAGCLGIHTRRPATHTHTSNTTAVGAAGRPAVGHRVREGTHSPTSAAAACRRHATAATALARPSPAAVARQ
jgi:hypothetical protein